MTRIEDLITKVREAKEPSRELFLSVLGYLVGGEPRGFEVSAFIYAHAWTEAALTLVEMKLPGWEWSFGTNHAAKGLFIAIITEDPIRSPDYTGNAPHPALSIILSLLMAVKETDHDAG